MTNKNNEIELKLLSEFNDNEADFKSIFEKYTNFSKMYSWIRILIFAIFIVIGIYNFFIAGKHYSISDYNMIKYTMASILLTILTLIIIITVITYRIQSKINIQIKELASSKNMDFKELKNEINILIKSSMGGSGI
ncbi:MAG: hypothetical protein N4A49_10915 [Marinifilaceae bacterium]|jgi:uncharacterized membrane protein|nr:hypothetical protein [Marinifilaceae bacterium]